MEINDTYQKDIPNLACTSRTDENILSSLPRLADVIELPDPAIIQNAVNMCWGKGQVMVNQSFSIILVSLNFSQVPLRELD